MLKLYGFSKVNRFARGKTRDLRVLWALEEMQIPYEIAGMDHPAHDLNAESYRHLSPFEQIPSIDDDGMAISESGAILIYLAKKSGRLIPGDVEGETQVLRWSFAAMNSIEPPLLNLMVLGWTSPEGCDKHRDFLLGWSNRMLNNLERWLDGREYIATDDFTVADILTVHVLSVVPDEALLTPYPRVLAYRDRCLARPAWKRTFDAYCERVEAA
ncbi:MAG TPA: glutathione S-transferase family protein [Pseudoxanthomonas sp.]|nr:glutathione S-transferase family protein [Pseudoxanthomonas sp.]